MPQYLPKCGFISIFSDVYRGSAFLTSCLQAARSCASLPDSPFSVKSCLMLSIHLASVVLSFSSPAGRHINHNQTYSSFSSHYMSIDAIPPTSFNAHSWRFLPLSLSLVPSSFLTSHISSLMLSSLPANRCQS